MTVNTTSASSPTASSRPASQPRRRPELLQLSALPTNALATTSQFTEPRTLAPHVSIANNPVIHHSRAPTRSPPLQYRPMVQRKRFCPSHSVFSTYVHIDWTVLFHFGGLSSQPTPLPVSESILQYAEVVPPQSLYLQRASVIVLRSNTPVPQPLPGTPNELEMEVCPSVLSSVENIYIFVQFLNIFRARFLLPTDS